MYAASVGGASTVLVASLILIVIAFIASRLVYGALLWLIGSVSKKRLSGQATRWNWRTRLVRSGETDAHGIAELRRRHRIEATALALSRLASIVIWLAVGVVILRLNGISVSVAIGSAGFIGLIAAYAAQSSVNDYVTGLHVLLEDRFGEGDDIEVMTANGRQVRGVVTSHGMFSTRLVADGVVHHVANRMMSEVTNHTQLGTVTVFEVESPPGELAMAGVAVCAQQSRDGLPNPAIDRVDSVESANGELSSLVHVRSSSALCDTDKNVLGEELRRYVNELGRDR